VKPALPEPIRLVFASSAATKPKPRFFTELPEDRAETPPEAPDFLSNVDARARDRAEGENKRSMPRLEGRSEAPEVAMKPGESVPQPGADADQDPAPQTLRPGAGDRTEDAARLRRSGRSGLLRRPGGAGDLLQQAMDNPWGDTALNGDISLSTTAWDYAPWLQRFRRDFIRDWHAPYAYYMGMIDGWQVLRLEISPEGKLLDLRVLEERGHASLREASLLSFRTMAPFRPLPIDFPEKSLVLQIKLVYPPLRRR